MCSGGLFECCCKLIAHDPHEDGLPATRCRRRHTPGHCRGWRHRAAPCLRVARAPRRRCGGACERAARWHPQQQCCQQHTGRRQEPKLVCHWPRCPCCPCCRRAAVPAQPPHPPRGPPAAPTTCALVHPPARPFAVCCATLSRAVPGARARRMFIGDDGVSTSLVSGLGPAPTPCLSCAPARGLARAESPCRACGHASAGMARRPRNPPCVGPLQAAGKVVAAAAQGCVAGCCRLLPDAAVWARGRVCMRHATRARMGSVSVAAPAGAHRTRADRALAAR